MSLTLGLTGMDPATETALKAAFDDGNARLGGAWRLLPEAEADHVVVDMDSMYGPMSWLRLHAAGRHVIGLTSAARSQTEFRLGRPFDGAQVAELLAEVARSVGVELAATPAPGIGSAAANAAPAAAEQHEAVAPAPVAANAMSAALDAVEAAPPPVAPAPPAAVAALPEPPMQAVPPDEDSGGTVEMLPVEEAEELIEEPPPVPDDLAAWLRPGALSGRVRFRRASGPTLFIDADNDRWHGPTPLNPLAGYFEGALEASDFAPVDAATWARETAAAGAPQPLARLRWLGGLLAGGGALLPGEDPAGRFALTKWPQTEREYPRHFRIATAMMKGPATVAEIAEASGIPEADVADFINANLATGYAEAVVEAPPVVEEPVKARAGGLLGRLRNR
ncbi:hypothetical protein [Luteimonas sp. MC1825]|uniref:hypothetical protein n=1 Tax=Luteimonas sp. MC1825 TaxID=2761107 RepID=UPI00160FE8D8|nr:hypothetical protein [Luteimonas sp. MC1825]MBB6599798.1 hypothetical protein [Luteimonas sp. MC1825]QOC87473.1 hypothetical protein IDM46_09415 [Luteimonas sp. MC1825]